MAPTELAGERQHRAVLVGEHDRLRAAADRRADIARGIDAGDIATARWMLLTVPWKRVSEAPKVKP